MFAINIPVNIVPNGTSSFGPPIEFSFSGIILRKFCTPSTKCPFPRASNAQITTENPPISNITPLIVSETTTAFNPPQTA